MTLLLFDAMRSLTRSLTPESCYYTDADMMDDFQLSSIALPPLIKDAADFCRPPAAVMIVVLMLLLKV